MLYASPPNDKLPRPGCERQEWNLHGRVSPLAGGVKARCVYRSATLARCRGSAVKARDRI